MVNINKHLLYSTHRIELFENINDTELIGGELHLPDDDYKIHSLNQFFKNNCLLRIPKFVVMALYQFGKVLDNSFIKENSIKLISDNIYTSKKIESYIKLDAKINDI